MRIHVGTLIGCGALVGIPTLVGHLLAVADAGPLFFAPPPTPTPVQGRVDLRPPEPEDSPRYAKHVPIDTRSGELLVVETDLGVGARGMPFAWVRSYSSRATHAGAFGIGWDLPYERRVVILANGDASVIDGMGREDVFPTDGAGGWTSPAGVFDVLTQEPDSTYTVTTPARTRFRHSTAGFLTHVIDRHGNTVTITRNVAHEITKIVDTQDRAYQVTYATVAGLRVITKLADFLGREVVYSYDAATGDLLKVRSPIVVGTPGGSFTNGKTTLYTWSSGASDARLNHNLLTITEPGYNVADDPSQSTPWLSADYYGVQSPTHLRFDRVHKVRWGHNQGGPPEAPNLNVGGNVLLFYQDNLAGDAEAPAGAVFRSIERDPNGNERVRYFDAGRQVVKLIERTNRDIRPGEGDHVTTYQYTAEGQYAAITYPRGNGVQFLYDSGNPQRRSQGNLLERRRVANGVAGGGVDLVTRFTWDPVFNQSRTETDPRAFPLGLVPLDVNGHLDLADLGVARYTTTSLFDYQEGTGFQAAQGVPTSERIPEGLGDQNGATDFNAGNVVKELSPVIQTVGPNLGDAIVETTQWNAFGQALQTVDGAGDVVQFEYFASNGFAEDPSDREGYLKARTVDPGGLALRIEWSYDQAGNVLTERDAKGQQMDFVVNALNQVVRRLSRPVATPTGNVQYQVDYFWSANDDLVRTETANLDENGTPYGHATVVDVFAFDILHGRIRETLDKTPNGVTGVTQTVVRETRFDANHNVIALRTPLAVSGAEPRNVRTILHDERDLQYRTVGGDNDLDPTNAPPADGTVEVRNVDGNRNTIEEIDAIRDAQHPLAPVTAFPGSGAGDVTRTFFDGFDRPVLVDDAEHVQHTTTYDLADHVIQSSVIGPVSEQVGASVRVLALVAQDFDELDRVVRVRRLHVDRDSGTVIGDGQAITEMRYDLDSRLVRTEDDRGNRTLIEWDRADRKTKLTDALGNHVALGYDANGNVTTRTRTDISTDLSTLPDVYLESLAYDRLDRLVLTRSATGDANEWFWDSRDNVVKTSDANRGDGHAMMGPGNIVRTEYDAQRRPLRVIRELRVNGRGDGASLGQILTQTGWDDNTRVATRTDDNLRVTTYRYDFQDRWVGTTYANLTSSTTAWDADSRVVTRMDQNGSVVQRGYDGLDRVRTVTVTRGANVIGTTQEHYGYDGASALTRAASDPAGDGVLHERRWQYDTIGQVVRDTQGGSPPVLSVHDGVGNRTRLTYPGAVGEGPPRIVDYAFDPLNRVRQITEPPSLTNVTFHYKGPNRLERRDYGTPGLEIATLDVRYDGKPRAIEFENKAGPGAMNPGATVSHHQYGYDRGDRQQFHKRPDKGGSGQVNGHNSANQFEY